MKMTAVAAVVSFVLLILSGCGTKKNTAMSRNWQAFTTRYNVYFNGNEHLKEELSNLERNYQDDYTRMLLIHPAEARADTKLPQPQGDFKRTIEKMQKAIQLHSIKKKPPKKSGSQKEKDFRAREEFNPFLHNAWMDLGKGQYYDGDFLGAAATFMYISKHFKWLPSTVTEARLWEALSYCAMDWNYEADNVLHLIKEKDLTDKKLRNLYNLAKADYNIRTEHYREAIPFLRDAAAAAHGSQKNRLWFLLGQVYTQTGTRQMAYEAYKKASSGSSTAYRTKFNARIKQSEVFSGQNIKKEVNALKSMTRFERNREYLDQIYYAIGNLYLSRKDTAEAQKNYILAVEKSTRNGIDKALAQLALGGIYFQKGEYAKAQPCYSEAVPMLPDNYPDYKLLKSRSDVLDELAVYDGNVTLQDSLLRLSHMTREEQEKICQKLADDLIKKEKEEAEEAKRAEFMAQQEGMQANINSSLNKNQPSMPTMMNTDKSWYFYNTMTKNAGKTEFQRRWGARKLEDDWRRRNKSSFSFDEPENENDNATDPTDPEANNTPEGDGGENGKTPKDKEAADRENNPHFMEFYLKQIPTTDAERQTSNDVIQEGLYNMGLILKDKLEDYPAARHEFLELDKRYPDNIYRLDVYYNLYLMAVRRDDKAQADHWRDMILEQFPDSPYGSAMRDPNYFDNLRRMNAMQEELYEKAYAAYLADDNSEVHNLTAEMEKDYPLSQIMPKFYFIDALSYLTEKDNDKFKDRLTELLQKWPETDMTDMAGSILRGLKAGRVPHAGLSNSRGMIWSMRLTNDSIPLDENGQPANFESDPESPQYLVLVFDRDSVNSNQVLYDVARFNFSSFVVKDFDLEPMNFGSVGLLVIKGFRNLRELQHYRDVMAKSGFDLPGGVRPVMISKPNFELLLREGRSFEEYFDFEGSTEPKLPEDPENSKDPENLKISENSENSEKTETSETSETSDKTLNTEDNG